MNEFPESGPVVEKLRPEIITFIFRGDNPYLLDLAEQAKSRFARVIVKSIPYDEWDDGYYNGTESLETVVEGAEGLVVVDNTIGSTVRSRNSINAYNLKDGTDFKQEKEKYFSKIGSVIAQVRADGLEPVVIEHSLGDHFRIVEEDETSFEARGTEVAEGITQRFEIEVISGEAFGELAEKMWNHEEINQGDTFFNKSENKVFLVDHHVVKSHKAAGAMRLCKGAVALICPCCLSNNYGRNYINSTSFLNPDQVYNTFADEAVSGEELDNLCEFLDSKR